MTRLDFVDGLDRAVRKLTRWADEQDPGWERTLARLVILPVRASWHAWKNRRYLTIRKLANIIVMTVESEFRRERVMGLPYVVKVDPTNICNSNCRLCPTGLGLKGRGKGEMSLEQFRAVIDQIKDHTYVVDLSNWGDPLTVPAIYEMIRYAHDAGLWTYTSSNLHAFRPEDHDPEAMVRSGLNMLNCSLHAASQAAYEAYQPGKKLEVVLSNVRAIVEAKRRLRSRTPVLRLFCVVTKYNEHEMDDFRRLARSLDCEPVFNYASLNLRLVDAESRTRKMEEWLPANEKWIPPWYRPNFARDDRVGGSGCKTYPCDWPWWGTVINWDGSVVVCSHDFDPGRQMGNILRQPLRTIWNNDSYRAARRSFRRPVNGPEGEPCRSCHGAMI